MSNREIDPGTLALLKEEYFHLQKVIEDCDQRSINIKTWSVTLGAAGIGASKSEPAIIFLSLIAAFAAIGFWCIESIWKNYQWAYYARIEAIETAFRDKYTKISPFQISTSWEESYKSNKVVWFIKSFFLIPVMFPHILIVIVGFIVYASRHVKREHLDIFT